MTSLRMLQCYNVCTSYIALSYAIIANYSKPLVYKYIITGSEKSTAVQNYDASEMANNTSTEDEQTSKHDNCDEINEEELHAENTYTRLDEVLNERISTDGSEHVYSCSRSRTEKPLSLYNDTDAEYLVVSR